MSEWQTIDTAPMDGTWMLLLWPMTRTSVIVSGKYIETNDGDGQWLSQPTVETEKNPTHWMLLPEPPKDIEATQ